MTGLRIAGLDVARDRCPVLHGIDAEVAGGGWLAVIGPNGAGKSTLLKAVVGLLPYRGDVTVDGVRLRDLPARELARTIAYTPQNPVVPPQMTVRDYVLLGRTPHLGYLAVPGRTDRAVADAVIDRLDLGALAARDVARLSGGERQRVVLARALAQQAPVLMLDEPTTALDLGHQQQVLELVDRLRRDDGLTVVTTLHDLGVAAQYAERMLLLVNGRAAASGTAAQVLTRDTIAEHYHAHVEVVAGRDGRPQVHVVRPGTGSDTREGTATAGPARPAHGADPRQQTEQAGAAKHGKQSRSGDRPSQARRPGRGTQTTEPTSRPAPPGRSPGPVGRAAADQPPSLPSVAPPRIVVHDGWPALVWELGPGWRAVSSAILGGGIGERAWVLNAQVRPGYSRMDPVAHLGEIAAPLALPPGAGVGMMTAALVEEFTTAHDGGVAAWVTTGIGVPTWAAAPDADAGARGPAAGDVPNSDTATGAAAGDPGPQDHRALPRGGASGDVAPSSAPAPAAPAAGPRPATPAPRSPFPAPGTINILAVVPAPLSDAALVNAVATATEAKVQALFETGYACTGTPSDAVCVVARVPRPGDDAEAFGGPRSLWGARLARAVHGACEEGALADRVRRSAAKGS